jgi:hypothetical protein
MKTKPKTNTETELTTVVATSPPLRLKTAATPVLPTLLPLRKQREQQRQHVHSGGSSSSRAVAEAAQYFELPHPITASGIKFPFLIRQYPSEKMILGKCYESPQHHST